MEKINDFEKMSIMSKQDMDIMMCPDIVGMQKKKKGYELTVGVPDSIGGKLIEQFATGKTKYYVALYIINKDQFDSIKG